MYDSYYVSSRVSKEIINSARIDIVEYTKRKMAHELLDKIMDNKEINLNEVVFSIQFAEFNVIEDKMYPLYSLTFPYKEIQGKLRVIPYAWLWFVEIS